MEECPPQERIEKAAEALVLAIKENGYHIDDIPVEQLGQGEIELFRYAPDDYHWAICAVPDAPEAQAPAALPPPTS